MPVETIVGTDGNDVILGTIGPDLILAGAGDDRVVTVDGRDTVWGESGDDIVTAYSGGAILVGGDGNDQLTTSEHTSDLIAVLRGGAGEDVILASNKVSHSYGGSGDDLVQVNVFHGGQAHGGLGVDRLALRFYDDELQVSTENVIVVLTGDGADVQIGASTHLNISGFECLDITLGAGDDSVDAGYLDDSLVLGGGKNSAMTRAGDDLISYVAGAANEINGGLGTDTLHVIQDDNRKALTFSVADGAATDNYGSVVTCIENYVIWGGAANDFIQLGRGGDQVQAGRGADLIRGRGGEDWLSGEEGQDTILGGDGADLIAGGLGKDILYGGRGEDEFQFTDLAEAGDVIHDFVVGEDLISIQQRALGFLLPKGLAPEARFHLGVASGTNGQFIYREGATPDEGELIWDRNGTADGGETLLATFEDFPNLQASSILIF